MWERVSARKRAAGFTWALAPLERLGNGPVVVEHWERTFARTGHGAARRARERGFAGVHANCFVKAFLAREENGQPQPCRPPSRPVRT